MSNRLLLRADGGPGIGNGHVLRSLSLAEAWTARGGEAVLASHRLPEELQQRVEAAAVTVLPVADGPASLEAAVASVTPEWVIFDGYHFGVDDHRAAHREAHNVAVIDDHGRAGPYEVELLVDQNLGVTAERYAHLVPPGALVLAGSRYVLLGRRFLSVRPGDPRDPVGRVLVSLGGSPPAEAVTTVRAAVTALGIADRTTFLVGGIAVDDMPSLLRSVDVALSAAGTTAWELCYLGVPTVLLPIVDNQEPVASALAEAGAAIAVARGSDAATVASATKRLLDDLGLRVRLSSSARRVVDGRGPARVMAQLRASALHLRPVEEGDARLLFAWANDPDTRRWSFDTKVIEWEEHVAWLQGRLRDREARLLVATDGQGEAFGSFRAAREGRDATVGVVVAPERRGSGWSAPLIAAASARLLREGWADRLHAWIKPENAASRSAFVDAGYDPAPGSDDPPALHYALAR